MGLGIVIVPTRAVVECLAKYGEHRHYVSRHYPAGAVHSVVRMTVEHIEQCSGRCSSFPLHRQATVVS